jgi:inhibitor of cysteine peptidase
MEVKNLLLLLVLILSVVALGACTGATMTLTMADSGKEISIAVGKEFVVKLDSNPTTGYTWEVAEMDEAVLKLVTDDFKPGGGAVGSGGTQTLRFKPLSAGQTPLKLVYHRPWEEGVEPEETFEIQVKVQ